jgi:molecular chaperone GrpE
MWCLGGLEKNMSDEQQKVTDIEQDDVTGVQTEAAESPEAEAVQAEEKGGANEDLTVLLEDARAKADSHWDQLLRTQAEMENVRRRSERDLANAHKYALDRFVQELLPVKDSLELGIAAVTGEGEEFAKLKEGKELTLKMLSDALEKFGVKEVNPVDQPFDPELHQAMSAQESADKAPNTVLMVYQKGYLLNDRLVRPAMVVVSKAPAASNNNGSDDEDEPKGPKIDEHA